VPLCRALQCQDTWLALLETFLNPAAAVAQFAAAAAGPAAASRARTPPALAHAQPDYAAACRVLNAHGAVLSPMALLAALPADMPLHLAANVLSRMLSGLQHRHRQGQVVR
jgi:hypothetical protein